MWLDKGNVRGDHPGDGLESPVFPPHLFHPPVCFKDLVCSGYLLVLRTVPPTPSTLPLWRHPLSPCPVSFPQLRSHPTLRWGSIHLPHGGSGTQQAERTTGRAPGPRPPRTHPASVFSSWESCKPKDSSSTVTLSPPPLWEGSCVLPRPRLGSLRWRGLSSPKSKRPKVWGLLPPALPHRRTRTRPPTPFPSQ